jgi:hypothetical protein
VSAAVTRPGFRLALDLAPVTYTITSNRTTPCRPIPRRPRLWWSRPMPADGCSMVARMPRYASAASGIRSAQRIPANGQNSSSRHVLSFFDSSSERRIEQSSALNPRVRGSSPWRRTRSDLGFCTPGRSRFRAGMGRGWPWYGRVPESRLLHRMHVAPPRRDGPAQPVLADVRVCPARSADLPARVSAAG